MSVHWVSQVARSALLGSCALSVVSIQDTLPANRVLRGLAGMLSLATMRGSSDAQAQSVVLPTLGHRVTLGATLPVSDELDVFGYTPYLDLPAYLREVDEVQKRESEDRAAIRIQSAVRRMAERKAIRENDAATCIQSLARGKAARKAAEHLREEEASRWSAQSIYRLAQYASMAGLVAAGYHVVGSLYRYINRRLMNIRNEFTLFRARVYEFYHSAIRAHQFYHHAIRVREFCGDLYCGIARTINTPVISACCMVAAVVFASTVM